MSVTDCSRLAQGRTNGIDELNFVSSLRDELHQEVPTPTTPWHPHRSYHSFTVDRAGLFASSTQHLRKGFNICNLIKLTSYWGTYVALLLWVGSVFLAWCGLALGLFCRFFGRVSFGSPYLPPNRVPLQILLFILPLSLFILPSIWWTLCL